MRCLGTLEFLCDFHNKCHNTQKDLESILSVEVNEKTEDKLESDEESDKENVLPYKYGRRKEKLVLEQIKCLNCIGSDENIVENTDISNDQSIGKTKDALCSISKNKHFEVTQNDFNVDTCKIDSQNVVNESILDNVSKIVNKITCSDNSAIEMVIKNSAQKSRSLKRAKNEKKLNKLSKSSITDKNKNNSTEINKTSNNCCKTPEKQVQSINNASIISNHNNVISNTCADTNKNEEENVIFENNDISNRCADTGENEKENIIFEATVINVPGEPSFIMPLKVESGSNELRLDNADMLDGTEIVQAQEITWISNNLELAESGELKSIDLNQIISSDPKNDAKVMKNDKTSVIQTMEKDMKVIPSTKQVILLEVQLPSTEKSIIASEVTTIVKRKRCLSTVSSDGRLSEGRFTKISELMTEKQKKDIETHYSIDMNLVNESEVDKNIIIIDKCKFKCKICEVIYPRLDKCQVHIWRHLDMKPYICRACDFSTLTVSNIRCHIRKSHLKIKPFQCHLCNKCYNSATLLEEHINIHKGLRPYQCNFCNFASTSKQVLAHHILIHKSKKDIICDICGKAFYSKGRMRSHKITHNKEQAFKCTLCSTYVLHEEALQRHYMNVHTQDYICKICKKVYKSRKALHNHESVHSDAKFECPMCPNVYKSTHILKEHILKHQGIRQYKCNSCQKSFAQQSHLAAHMAVHSDITYNCPGCQRGFNRHDNMKVHTKRCEKFLANPELQQLLTKRKINFSKNLTAKVSLQKRSNNCDDKRKNCNKFKKYSKKSEKTEKPIIESIEQIDNKIANHKNV